VNKSDKKIHDKSWLQRVAEQSWEPELLISGLAIFATLNLPEYVWKFYEYYTYNLQLDNGFIDDLIPILVVGVTLTALQVLSFAFIFHFIVRAFWVGLMGLTSVYQDGIKYEELKFSDYYKKEMKRVIGDKDSFLLNTDKLASVIFSVAFLFVLYLFGVMVIYIVFFLMVNGVKLIVSPEVFGLYSKILLIVAGVVLGTVSIASLVLNMERFRTKDKYAKLHFMLSWNFSKVFYPFIYKPIQYLMNCL
jgi:cadmium resistance protein CadD (predicted permease)